MKYTLSALIGIGLLIMLAYLGAASQYVSAGRLSDAPNDTPTDTLTETLTSTPTVTNTPDPCAPVWSGVPSAGVALNGVATVSASDVWAVGSYSGSTLRTLVEHWDGISWSVVPSPSVGRSTNQLYGVAAVSANDVWAVGYYDYGSGTNAVQTLVEHWNGTSWSVVPSPNPVTCDVCDNELHGVAVVSSSDIWAVGYFNYLSQTLVEHWNGSSWSVVSSPNVGTNINRLLAVGVVSANDLWAVGDYWNSSTDQTLTEHWDGTSWSVVPSPNPITSYNYLNGVAVVSANDVWAVGVGGYSNVTTSQTLVEHWDGTSWSVVSSPNVGIQNSLYGVAAVSANDVWAVGDYHNGSIYQTLVEHWEGSAWSVVPSPSESTLNGVAVVAANDMWAVGYYSGGTLVEHYASPCAPTNTPTTTPTSTPAPMLVGHVTWQGPPAQPNARQQLPITLTLKLGATEVNYPSQNTDASGFFTVPLGSLTGGEYEWRVKGAKYLANSGVVSLGGGPSTQVEMGLMRAGDANGDNLVTVVDVNMVRRTFALCVGDVGYDARGDFDNSNCVSIVDFNLLRGNFGFGGAPPIVGRGK